MWEINTWEGVIGLPCLQKSHLGMCRFLNLILFCNFTFMGQTLLGFIFSHSFGWGLQIIFYHCFLSSFLLDVLSCVVACQPTNLCNESHSLYMAFYEKKETFQSIGEDNWIEYFSLFPTTLYKQVRGKYGIEWQWFLFCFVSILKVRKQPWGMVICLK